MVTVASLVNILTKLYLERSRYEHLIKNKLRLNFDIDYCPKLPVKSG